MPDGKPETAGGAEVRPRASELEVTGVRYNLSRTGARRPRNYQGRAFSPRFRSRFLNEHKFLTPRSQPPPINTRQPRHNGPEIDRFTRSKCVFNRLTGRVSISIVDQRRCVSSFTLPPSLVAGKRRKNRWNSRTVTSRFLLFAYPR